MVNTYKIMFIVYHFTIDISFIKRFRQFMFCFGIGTIRIMYSNSHQPKVTAATLNNFIILFSFSLSLPIETKITLYFDQIICDGNTHPNIEILIGTNKVK